MTQIWLKDIRFVRGIRDPAQTGERGERHERLTWTKDRPFTVRDEQGWLKIVGARCEVWVPKTAVEDAIPMSAAEQAAAEAFYAEQDRATKRAGAK